MVNKSLTFSSLAIATSFVVFFFSSCENDLEVVKTLSSPDSLPDVSAYKMEILYSDSAKVRGKVIAAELKYFRTNQDPYFEYPKGIHVYFYDDSLKVSAEISAKYAIYHEYKKIWEARNNVVVVNVKGEKLNTEQLFWDLNQKIIYSKKYCIITTPDGNINEGEAGMEAQEDFSNWKLFGAKGSMNVDDPQ